MKCEVSCKNCGRLTGPYNIGQDDAITVELCVCHEIEIEQLQAELDKYEAIEENSWDLRCEDVPTCGDDCDIAWIVIEHHMAKPKERIIGRGKTPLEAIEQASKGE